MKHNTIFKANAILLLFVGCSLGAEINVRRDQPTIQAAVDAASSGDIVIVAPGTYSVPVQVNDKGITLTSLNPDEPATVGATVSTSTCPAT